VIDFDALVQIDRGYYNSFQVELTDEISGNPLDLTGYTLSATFRERGSTPLLLTLGDPDISSPTEFDQASGMVTVVISEASSELLPSRDQTHCGLCLETTRTCIMQINGVINSKNYLLATIAIDNISSTLRGETP
jgi:hypothetical protein